MFVSVIHRISDPERFLKMAADVTEKLPSNLRVPQYLTSDDHRTMVCLWDAPSVATVRDFLEPLTQGMCVNEYVALDPSASSGLPTSTSV